MIVRTLRQFGRSRSGLSRGMVGGKTLLLDVRCWGRRWERRSGRSAAEPAEDSARAAPNGRIPALQQYDQPHEMRQMRTVATPQPRDKSRHAKGNRNQPKMRP